MQPEHQGNIRSERVIQPHNLIVRELTAPQHPDYLRQRLRAALNQFGFSDFAVMHRSLSRASHCFLTSLPKELLDSYQERRLYQYDMVLDYLKTGNLQPLHYSTLRQAIEKAGFLTHSYQQNLEILALYQQFEFNDAYLIPVQTHSGSRGGVDGLLFSVLAKGIAPAEFVALTKKSRAMLQLLGDVVVRIYQTQLNDYKTKPLISRKPLRLLTTMAKYDLTLSQAADQLCISVDTANKHMSLAKQALGTRSQANAVYLALKQGLIDFS